jgi:lantibiotic modifying enzyme
MYLVLLKSSLSPNCLRDGIERSIQLDLLSQALLADEFPNLFWKVLKIEHEQISRLDVPLFISNSDNTNLHLTSEETIQGCFLEPSYQNIITNFHNLNEEDLAHQISLIEGSMVSAQ